jgi:osmoprotectant transport system permease protein
VNVFSFGWDFLSNAANWHGPNGIPVRLEQHLEFSGIALGIALVIGLPLGLLIGHGRRGGFAVTAIANLSRALPSLGLLTLLVLLLGITNVAVQVPLVLLGVPSILLNTYEGVRGVDPRLSDAAKGMGMTWWQTILRVELPSALPLILVGVRTAAVMIVSTATIAAYASYGGLGRFIIDGLASHDYTPVVGGALLAAVLAIVTLLVFTGIRRLLVSPGLREESS